MFTFHLASWDPLSCQERAAPGVGGGQLPRGLSLSGQVVEAPGVKLART